MTIVDLYVWYVVAAVNGGAEAEGKAREFAKRLSAEQLKLAEDRLAAFSARQPADRWHFYTDKRGGHRWRRISPNGKLVSASQVGYRSRNAAVSSAEKAGYKRNDP